MNTRQLLAHFLPWVLLVGWLQLAIALWVPPDLHVIPIYLSANLIETIQPRALIGTLWHYLGLNNIWFLFATQAALFTWLFTVSLLIATPRETRVPAPLEWRTCGLIFIFSFSTLPFITNTLSGFVDIFAAAALVVSVWLVHQRKQPSPLSLAGMVLLLCVATLIHEKSIFDVLILLLWLAFTRGRRQAMAVIFSYSLFLASYLYLISGVPAAGTGISGVGYLSGSIIGESSTNELYKNFNVFGVVFAGGVLWGLYATCAALFVRARRAVGNPFPPAVLVIAMLALCFAPLLVAADTSRLVAIIWLPTLLLLLELNCRALFKDSRLTATALCAACLLQALVPPVMIYWNPKPEISVAYPSNCYSAFMVERLVGVLDSDAWPFDRDFKPMALSMGHVRACADRGPLRRLVNWFAGPGALVILALVLRRRMSIPRTPVA